MKCTPRSRAEGKTHNGDHPGMDMVPDTARSAIVFRCGARTWLASGPDQHVPLHEGAQCALIAPISTFVVWGALVAGGTLHKLDEIGKREIQR